MQKKEEPIIQKIKDCLEKEKFIRTLNLKKEEKQIIKKLQLLTQKPIMYVCNIDENDMSNYLENLLYQKIQQKAKIQDAPLVAISGKIEKEISQLSKEEEKEFLREYGLKESNMQVFIREAYKLLDYITFFTAGPQEVKAWQIKRNTLAPKAAGKIHSDIEKGFIRAEVLSYKNWEEFKSFKKAQESGKVKIEGKDYVIQDGDIVYFRFSK